MMTNVILPERLSSHFSNNNHMEKQQEVLRVAWRFDILYTPDILYCRATSIGLMHTVCYDCNALMRNSPISVQCGMSFPCPSISKCLFMTQKSSSTDNFKCIVLHRIRHRETKNSSSSCSSCFKTLQMYIDSPR